MCGFLGAAIVNKWYLCVYADGSDMYVLQYISAVLLHIFERLCTENYAQNAVFATTRMIQLENVMNFATDQGSMSHLSCRK